MIEETEVKDETFTTLRADLYPGMKDAVLLLKEYGYILALVADTRPGTYKNVLTQHGLYDVFSAFAISEELETAKPDPKMFRHVLDTLNIAPEDAVMCGNHLTRDVGGANALGMTTIWFHWNERYATKPANQLELPDYTVRSAREFVDLGSQHFSGHSLSDTN